MREINFDGLAVIKMDVLRQYYSFSVFFFFSKGTYKSHRLHFLKISRILSGNGIQKNTRDAMPGLKEKTAKLIFEDFRMKGTFDDLSDELSSDDDCGGARSTLE